MRETTTGYCAATSLDIAAVGKTGRGAGVGDQWVKPGDWELRDRVSKLAASIPK